jgi:hypothetical protein
MPCCAMAPSGTPPCPRPLDTQYGCSPIAGAPWAVAGCPLGGGRG